MASDKIDIHELLSACVSLSHAACGVIRDVQRSREKGESIGAAMKDPTDSKSYLTVADKRAQQLIVDALLEEWPGLPIVAEEDERDEGWEIPDRFRNCLVKDLDRFAAGGKEGEEVKCLPVPEDLQDLSIQDVCVFVDPVDGTREFVQGRLLSCQCLIGIAVRGRSVAGVIGLPFHDKNYSREATKQAEPPSTASGVLIYALGNIVRGIDAVSNDTRGNYEEDQELGNQQQHQHQWVSATSAKVKEDALVRAQEVIDSFAVGGTEAARHTVAGGCGNKILRLLTGEADVTLFNLGTSVWDTCATEAVLRAMGGHLTNIFGWPIDHKPTSYRQNRFGVLATSARFEAATGITHVQLVDNIVQQPQVMELLQQCGYYWEGQPASSLPTTSAKSDTVPPQAIDICRTISGQPFTLAYLGETVYGDASAVEGWTAPEEGAVRYKQSHACRIHLRTKKGSGDGGGVVGAKDVASVFCKRIVLRELPYAVQKATTAPFKLARDVRANGVEASFLHSAALKEFVQVEAKAVKEARVVAKVEGGGSDAAAAGAVRGSTRVPPSHQSNRNGCTLPVVVQKIAARVVAKKKIDAVDSGNDKNDDDNGGCLHVSSEIGLPYNTEAISYPSHPIDSRFSLLLFDFNHSLGWEQRPLLQSRLELYATLQSLARFHAFFWIGKGGGASGCGGVDEGWGARLAREDVVWDTGSYWDLGKLRPHILDEIQPKWTRIVDAFQTVFQEDESYLCMNGDEIRSVGKRLHAMAARVCWRTHGQHADGTKGKADEGGTDEGCYTVLHGDPKAANFFYNRTQHGNVGSTDAAGVGSLGVGMIDFQWTGVGKPSTDIAYCLAASASGLVLDRDMEELDGENDAREEGGNCVGELQCLRYYHTCLMQALVENGVVGTMEEGECMLSYTTFRRQFQEGMVDLFRTVVSDWWTSMTPTLLEEREGAMAYNACNKSMHTALWLIKYTAACMRRLEKADATANGSGAHL